MAIIELTNENFEQEVMKSDKPVLIDFWAGWCGPCRMIAPIIDQIAAERPDIKVCKLNVDNEPQIAASYNVMMIPTLTCVKSGQVSAQVSKALPKAAILEMLN